VSNRMDSRNRVLPQMLVVPLLCWILTGAAIAQPKNEGALSAETRTELSTSTRGSSFEKYDNLPIVASIDNPGNNRYEIV
jgi:hypothetical protein